MAESRLAGASSFSSPFMLDNLQGCSLKSRASSGPLGDFGRIRSLLGRAMLGFPPSAGRYAQRSRRSLERPWEERSSSPYGGAKLPLLGLGLGLSFFSKGSQAQAKAKEASEAGRMVSGSAGHIKKGPRNEDPSRPSWPAPRPSPGRVLPLREWYRIYRPQPPAERTPIRIPPTYRLPPHRLAGR